MSTGPVKSRSRVRAAVATLGSLRSLASGLREEGPLLVSKKTLKRVVAILLTFSFVASLRFYRLDELQGEWYGDISTLYEYVQAVRDHNFPPDLYNLGVGPLYPLVLSPILAVLGETYLGIKCAAALFSLFGLFVLFLLCRRLQGTGFALVATMVAGTGSWLLVFSRLGDIQALVLLFTVGPLALAAHVIETRPVHGATATLCGFMTGSSLYLYGAAFAVPALITLVMVAFHFFTPEPRRYERRHLWLYFVALTLAVLPMALSYLRSPEAVAQGHFATRLVRGRGAVSTVAGNFAEALLAYVTVGDVNSRANPPLLPHIDRLSLLMVVLGCVFWLGRSRRRWGFVLMGGFLLMHAPSILAESAGANAGRTIAAAPFAYILAAEGSGASQLLFSAYWEVQRARRRWRCS